MSYRDELAAAIARAEAAEAELAGRKREPGRLRRWLADKATKEAVKGALQVAGGVAFLSAMLGTLAVAAYTDRSRTVMWREQCATACKAELGDKHSGQDVRFSRHAFAECTCYPVKGEPTAIRVKRPEGK